LHFAKVFVEDPVNSLHTILVSSLAPHLLIVHRQITLPQTKQQPTRAERDADWKKRLVGTSREDLTQRILNLSVRWSKERAKEGETNAEEKERPGTSKPCVIEESDSDVVLEDVITLDMGETTL
jgi:hypothetical protein